VRASEAKLGNDESEDAALKRENKKGLGI